MSGRGQNAQPARPRVPPGFPQEVGFTDSWLTDRIVTITVGRDEKRWAVHEKLLSCQSEFFNQYFNGSDEEGGEAGRDREELRLPDEDPKLFALFMRWLYGTAFATGGGNRIFRFPPPDGQEVTVRDYLALYVLGCKFGILGVRNAAIDVLYTHYGEASDDHEAPNLHDVKYIFDNTTPEAPIRRFLIVHALFFLFSKNRRNAPLPDDWAQVLTEHGEIGYAMVRMLGEWNWVMGVNAPPMKVKARHEFHERLPEPPVVKDEPAENLEQ